jgi:hypothetical protein
MNGVPSLRTFTATEIVDHTFRIYRENFMTCIGLVAVVSIPITIIQLLLTASSFSSLDFTSSSAATRQQLANLSNTFSTTLLVISILALVQLVITNGPLIYIASESFFGRKVSIGEAFRETRSRFFNLGCGFIVFSFVVGVFALAVTFIGALCAPVWLALGIVVYMAIAIYMALMPVLVLEDVGASHGLNRAWALGRARFWQGLGVMVAIGVISYIISLAFGMVASLLVAQGFAGASFTTQQIVNQILGQVIGVFILPLTPIALTVLYYDIRIRVEGLDIALQALDNPNARPSDLEAPRLAGSLNGKDWRNIVILTVGGIVIVVGAGGLLSALVSSIVSVR